MVFVCRRSKSRQNIEKEFSKTKNEKRKTKNEKRKRIYGKIEYKNIIL
jgi:hypothetical protein